MLQYFPLIAPLLMKWLPRHSNVGLSLYVFKVKPNPNRTERWVWEYEEVHVRSKWSTGTPPFVLICKQWAYNWTYINDWHFFHPIIHHQMTPCFLLVQMQSYCSMFFSYLWLWLGHQKLQASPKCWESHPNAAKTSLWEVASEAQSSVRYTD